MAPKGRRAKGAADGTTPHGAKGAGKTPHAKLAEDKQMSSSDEKPHRRKRGKTTDESTGTPHQPESVA